MRLYICADGSYAGTQADAKAMGKGWEQVEVPTDKAGLIDYLNARYESISRAWDADVQEARQSPVNAPPAHETAPSYVHQSVAFEDAWQGFSLALKLHFAAQAMEAARDAL